MTTMRHELNDFRAKLRFAFLALLLAPVGASLTALGVPRPIAAIVLFVGLVILAIRRG